VSAGEEPAAPPAPGAEPGRLVARAPSAGDPTGWFEPLYAAAEEGTAVVPWDRGAPHWLLTAWAERKPLNGDGRRALVVGCGLGADAEYVAGRGFAVLAFDISASAIRAARRRFPGSAVDYQVAGQRGRPFPAAAIPDRTNTAAGPGIPARAVSA